MHVPPTTRTWSWARRAPWPETWTTWPRRGSWGGADVHSACVADSDDTIAPAFSPAGDMDGDGLDDILLSLVYYEDTDFPGRTFLVPASVLAEGSVSLLETAGILAWEGEVNGDRAGSAIAGDTDLDADGYPDIVISAPHQDAGGTDAGAVYLVSGMGF